MKLIPRISLLTLLFVMTTAALAISLWQMGQDIVPLRQTVRELREELGQFHVDDYSRLHVQRGKTITGNAWKWRVFLPTASECQLLVAEGDFTELLPGEFEIWQRRNHFQGRSLDLSDTGQFSLELAVEQYGGKWWIRSATKNQVRGSTQLYEDWYSELGAQTLHSDASYERVSITDPDEPIVLLYARRGEKEQVGENWVVSQTGGKARTLVIWISAKDAIRLCGATP